MPGLDHQLCVLAIGNGLPSCAEDLLENRVREQMVRRSCPQPVDGRAQRSNRAEGVGNVRGCGVNSDRLSDDRLSGSASAPGDATGGDRSDRCSHPPAQTGARCFVPEPSMNRHPEILFYTHPHSRTGVCCTRPPQNRARLVAPALRYNAGNKLHLNTGRIMLSQPAYSGNSDLTFEFAPQPADFRWNVFPCDATPLALNETLASGQAFRWRRDGHGSGGA